MLRKNLLRKLTKSYKGNLRRGIALLFLIVGMVLVLWFVFIKSSFFTVKNISVKPKDLTLISTEDVKIILENKFLGKSIFLSKKELENMVYANFPSLKNVTSTILFPNALVIKLQERTPSAFIKTDFQESFFVVDSEGFVLGVSDTFDKDLPLINYKENMIFSGSTLTNDKILSAVRFLSELKKVKLAIVNCVINENIVITTKSPTIEVLIPIFSEKQENEKAILLQKIIQKYSIEGKNVKRIDLRFSNPIIDF